MKKIIELNNQEIANISGGNKKESEIMHGFSETEMYIFIGAATTAGIIFCGCGSIFIVAAIYIAIKRSRGITRVIPTL